MIVYCKPIRPWWPTFAVWNGAVFPALGGLAQGPIGACVVGVRGPEDKAPGTTSRVVRVSAEVVGPPPISNLSIRPLIASCPGTSDGHLTSVVLTLALPPLHASWRSCIGSAGRHTTVLPSSG